MSCRRASRSSRPGAASFPTTWRPGSRKRSPRRGRSSELPQASRVMSADFDLFVIGAGSGGVRAARVAAQHGARVAIAEEFRVGGTCVIRGCVPKKLLVLASRFSHEFEDAAGYGWTVPDPTFH